MQVKLLVDGGEMKPGPGISQKIGPLGLNLGKLISDVNKATSEFKGIKVPVTLDINTKTKEVAVKVSTPPASELLKKELGLAKASQQPDKIKVANAAIEQVIKVAKTKLPDMLTEDINNSIISVLGTCVSLGILVESKDPRTVIAEFRHGEYNDIVKHGKDASHEKLEKLAKDFEQVKKSQEAVIKELEKKAEEKAAAAAAAAAPAAAAPAQAAAKPEEKKK